MTAAGQDGERLVTDAARMVAIGRVAAALSSPDPERPGVAAWVAHDGLARISELATDGALAAVVPDVAADAYARGVEDGRGDLARFEDQIRRDCAKKLLRRSQHWAGDCIHMAEELAAEWQR